MKKRKRRRERKEIERILAYSVKMMIEKKREERSVINPATNSDSASGRSKGTLFDSASVVMKREERRENEEDILMQ